MNFHQLKAGAATVDITPQESHFLYGYPFVERMSTGTHDALLSSAVYLTDGNTQVMFISNDVIYLDKSSVARIRRSISEKTGIPQSNILIGATHTHSAPVTVDLIISANDPVVPKVDKNLLKFVEKGAIEAGNRAFEKAKPAEIGFVTADATGVGTNRHDPSKEKDMDVPVMSVRNKNNEFIACMLVCSMHPTILHEDSTLYSSDFPHYVRETLQNKILGKDCPVIYFTGTAGNQSPRHVTQANTFAEAKRIGEIVAESVIAQLSGDVLYRSDTPIVSARKPIELPKRRFPPVEWAERHRNEKKQRFESLKTSSKVAQEIRTAEVDWFGSEELLYLSTLAQTDSLEKVYESCLPAEIQIIRISDRAFIAWPGEVFVEYGLELKKRFPKISLITYANGELQGYIVTEEAHEKGFYEAGNSLFDYTAGEIMTAETVRLLKELDK